MKHKLFIDFTIIANLHDAVMIVFWVLKQPAHLAGDVVWIAMLLALPLIFYPQD